MYARVILLAALIVVLRPVAGACPVGDLPCACAAAGGRWDAHKPPLEPLCTIGIRHQGEPHSRFSSKYPL